ncbi:hypothetical protein LSAT2_019679 [Lamellibrachia satsuma]|nr:hypothetical protein LSAT2_019679 [Lamellibrachia satsuma]
MSGTQAQNTADLTPEEVADFLDANRDFAREWFLSQDWLVTECLSKGSSKTALTEEDIEEGDVASDSNDRNPIMSSMFDALVRGRRRKAPPKTRRRTKVELMGMNDKDLLMELIRDIANELDVDTLCHKILLNVSTLTRCDRGSLFLVGGNRDHKYLVSKLFDVTENSSLAASLHTPEKQFRVPFGKGIAGTVALTKEHINIHNAYEVSRLRLQSVCSDLSPEPQHILTSPRLFWTEAASLFKPTSSRKTRGHESRGQHTPKKRISLRTLLPNLQDIAFLDASGPSSTASEFHMDVADVWRVKDTLRCKCGHGIQTVDNIVNRYRTFAFSGGISEGHFPQSN